MTISDKTKALFDTKALGMLGIVSEDGTAQVTPVWITLDGDTPVFNTVKGRSKERIMRRDPRVTLTIVDPENAYSYVELRGKVEFEEGSIANDTIDALAKKYIDEDKYPWAQPGDERVNLRLDVERELGM
jgi:PPOX class probable F420-dependent enzyme